MRLCSWEALTRRNFDEALSEAESAQVTLSAIAAREKSLNERERRVALDEQRHDILVPETLRVEALDMKLAERGSQGIENLEALVDLIVVGFTPEAASAIGKEVMRLQLNPEEASKQIVQMLSDYPDFTQAIASLANQIRTLRGVLQDVKDKAQQADALEERKASERNGEEEGFRRKKAWMDGEISLRNQELRSIRQEKENLFLDCEELNSLASTMKSKIAFVNALMKLIEGSDARIAFSDLNNSQGAGTIDISLYDPSGCPSSVG